VKSRHGHKVTEPNPGVLATC